MVHRPERQVLVMALVLMGVTGLAMRGTEAPPVVNRAVGRLVTPVQAVLMSTTGRIARFVNGVRQVEELRTRNAWLEDRLADLQSEQARLEEMKREIAQLRRELDFRRSRVDLSLSGASIIARLVAGEPGSLQHSLRIDVGERDGIREGMAVACSRGLVGRVARTGPFWSDVRLITDPRSAVWARVQRSRATGVVFGSTSGELRLRFVPQNESDAEPAIAVGDLIYTSGLSLEYPPRLLIGQVTKVFQSDEQTHQEAVVRPAVDFNALEQVLVVRDWLPAGSSGQASNQAPDAP